MDSKVQEQSKKKFTPVVTWALIALNVMVYLSIPGQSAAFGMIPAKYLIQSGALSSTLVWKGEVWRLFTAMFLHGAFWHLLMNMWVLNAIGGYLEKLLGRSNYLLLYLLSGVFAFCTSLLLHPGVSVGASGAIFGVTGGLLSVAFITRGKEISKDLFASLWPFIAGTLAIGFLIPIVDNTAHVGGLLMGVLLGFAFGVDAIKPKNSAKEHLDTLLEVEYSSKESRAYAIAKEENNSLERMASHIVLVLSLVFFVGALFLAIKPTFSPYYYVQMGYSALRKGEVDEAEKLLRSVLKLAPDDDNVQLLKARILLQNKQDLQAHTILKKVLNNLNKNHQMAAMYKAVFELGFSSQEPLEADLDFSIALCKAAIFNAEHSEESDLQISPAELYNNCAWFQVVKESFHGDAELAVKWAKKGIAQQLGVLEKIDFADLSSGDKQYAMMVFHTLATAYSRQGDLQQAIALMERLQSEGYRLPQKLELDTFHWKQAQRRLDKKVQN